MSYRASLHAAMTETMQRVFSGSSDWECVRAMRRQKAAARD